MQQTWGNSAFGMTWCIAVAERFKEQLYNNYRLNKTTMSVTDLVYGNYGKVRVEKDPNRVIIRYLTVGKR